MVFARGFRCIDSDPSVKWVNLSTSNTDGGEYQLNYVLGGVINATFIVTLNSSSITFDYAFLTLQNLVAEKYGWMWVFNQTTEGYTPEIVDMMWGYQNGVEIMPWVCRRINAWHLMISGAQWIHIFFKGRKRRMRHSHLPPQFRTI